MSVVVVEPPSLAAPLVSLDLAKRHLRVDSTDDDDLIEFYLTAAQSTIDGPSGWLGRCIAVQTLELRLDGFPNPIWGWGYEAGSLFFGDTPSIAPVSACARSTTRVALPYPPLIEVVSVTYEDASGQQQTLPSAAYLASDDGLSASFGTSFPSGRWEPGAVRIQYRAGYDIVPRAITAAILLMVGDLYSNRATVETGVRAAAVSVPMSTTVENLLSPYRVFG